MKKKLETQGILLDRFREQLKAKQAEISTEHAAYGDMQTELEFTQREVLLRDQHVEKLQERIDSVEKERAAEAEKRRQAQTRISDLEGEKAALESKYARSNPLNEALAAKQKAEAAARVAQENLNALKQEYQRLLHLSKNDGDYNSELVNKINKLNAKNESLEKELGQLRCEANGQIINLHADKNKVNHEYQKLTRERAHLDSTIADLKASNGLLRHEREKTKSDLHTVRQQLDQAYNDRKNEKIRTTVVVTKLGEEIKSLKLRLVDYQSKAGNEDLLRQMLEKKNKELANLQATTDEKLSLLASSMKGSTENLHAQIEALKAALLRKAEELQRLKFEHGNTIELEPIGISFQKQDDGTVKVVEGPGVSREGELKGVINDLMKQLERLRADNKRLKEMLKSTEDECDCLQNCFKENTRLEGDVEKYRRIIQEMMAQSRTLTKTAREMGFHLPGHSGHDSFTKDKESIKKLLLDTPSRRSSRTKVPISSGAATGAASGAATGDAPGAASGAASGPDRSDAASKAASKLTAAPGVGVDIEGNPDFVVDGKLVKLDEAVTAAMTARDAQLRGVLRTNMEQMGLDDQSIITVAQFQDDNVGAQ